MADDRTDPKPTIDMPRLPALNPADADEFPVYSSLPTKTDDHRVQLLSIIEGPSQKGGDLLGAVISYSDYIIFPVELVDDSTGELVTKPCTLLPQPNGPPVQFVSAGVIKSLTHIAKLLERLPPYDPPVEVKIIQAPTRSGGRTYKLQPVVRTP